MSLSSINTNIAASSARSNIQDASRAAGDSISRLSSGQRITRAADDVASLSVGTSLRTQVTTLRTALGNSTQASSLLQVADGALTQQTEILQRAKAIAVQAGSGSLSDTERSFLNQEFQALSAEIDRISESTNFNGVQLINGDLAGGAAVESSVQDTAISLNPSAQTFATITGASVDTETLVVAGKTFTATAAASVAGDGTFDLGTDAATAATAIVAALNADEDLAAFQFSNVAGVISVEPAAGAEFSSKAEATLAPIGGTSATVTPELAVELFNEESATVLTLATAVPVDGDSVTVGGVTVEFTTDAVGTADANGLVRIGADVAETAANVAEFLNSNNDARLANFSFSSDGGAVEAVLATGELGGTAGLSITSTVVTAGTPANFTAGTATVTDALAQDGLGGDRVRGLGEVGGNLLANANTGGSSGAGFDISEIRNNEAFIGELGEGHFGEFEATFNSADTLTLSIQVGDVTYSSAATDITSTTATTITLNGSDADGNVAGGSFTLTLRENAVDTGSVTSQSGADGIASQLTTSFANVDFVQSRDISSFQAGANVEVNGVQVARLDGVSVDLRSDDFTNVDIQSFNVTAPTNGSDAVFTAVINGESYESLNNIGSTFDNNTAIQLQSTTNPNNVLTIVTGGNDIASSNAVSIDVSSVDNAAAVTAAFQEAFGLNGETSSLSFQVGATSSDSISVAVGDTSTNSLFAGAQLDVLTQESAAIAADAIDVALNTVTSIRADVGALQSRFDFASANVESSIQNQDAARGALLDTDIAAESTAFATAQVQLQAGISVLAQANQLPQNLLKLIG